MAYSPPVTFTNGTPLDAADLLSNDDALRAYLHEGVANGDLRTSARWVETRHIQQPNYEPVAGLQTGVSGTSGGHTSGGPRTRLTFVSSFIAGTGRGGDPQWAMVPETSLELDTRRSGRALYHWSLEAWVGPDDVPTSTNPTASDARRVYLAPAVVRGGVITPSTSRAQEVRQNQDNWLTASPGGAEYPFNLSGYGLRAGTHLVTFGTGERLSIGLALYSQVMSSVVFNWSIAVEAYYL